MAACSSSVRRILFLEHNVDGTVGGSHYCLLDICRGIDRTRFTPIVWFYQAHSLIPDFVEAGVPHVVSRPSSSIRLQHQTSPRLLSKFLMVVQSAANFIRIFGYNTIWWMAQLKRRRVALVHLNNSCSADLDIQIAAYVLGIPLVSHQRGFAGSIRGVTLWLAKRQQVVIAISTAIQDHLLGNGLTSDAVRLIFDGIDSKRLSDNDTDCGQLPQISTGRRNPLVGIVGNIKPWKGQEIVIRAIHSVVDRYPTIQCWIVGAEVDAEYSGRIRALMKELRLEEHVSILGFCKDSARLMQKMDIVLHASLTPEPFGIVLLEAMHYAKPVIASSHGGPLDIVVPGRTGILTPAGDSAELAKAVIQILDNRNLASEMGVAGQNRFRELFSADVTVPQIEAVYESVFERCRTRGSRILRRK